MMGLSIWLLKCEPLCPESGLLYRYSNGILAMSKHLQKKEEKERLSHIIPPKSGRKGTNFFCGTVCDDTLFQRRLRHCSEGIGHSAGLVIFKMRHKVSYILGRVPRSKLRVCNASYAIG